MLHVLHGRIVGLPGLVFPLLALKLYVHGSICSVFFIFLEKKIIAFVFPKAITWGHPLVIALYDESVGLRSSDSLFSISGKPSIEIRFSGGLKNAGMP